MKFIFFSFKNAICMCTVNEQCTCQCERGRKCCCWISHVRCKWMLKAKRIVAQMNRKETITSYNGACTRMCLHSNINRIRWACMHHRMQAVLAIELKVFAQKQPHQSEKSVSKKNRYTFESYVCIICIWCLSPWWLFLGAYAKGFVEICACVMASNGWMRLGNVVEKNCQ